MPNNLLFKMNSHTDWDEKKAEEIGNVPMIFLQTVPNVVNMLDHTICKHVSHKPN